MSRRALAAVAVAIAALGAIGVGLSVYPRAPRNAAEQLTLARAREREIAVGAAADRPKRVDAAVAGYDGVESFPDQDGAHEAALRDATGLLARERRHGEAEVRVKKLIARTPPPSDAPALRLRIGEWRESAGDFEGARNAYVELAALHKDAKEADEAAFRAALILDEKIEDVPIADVITSWEDFVKTYPKSKHAPEALFRLAHIYLRIKELGRAIPAFQRIVDEYGDSDQAARALQELGRIYGKELDKPKEAAKAYQDLEEKYGDTPAGSGARAFREESEREAAERDEEEYRESHYGGRTADLSDIVAKTPREMMSEMIAMRLDVRHIEIDATIEPAARRLEADVRVDIAHAGDGPRRDLTLIFLPSMKIGQATWDGVAVEATHEGERLHVKLPVEWPAGEVKSLRVKYASSELVAVTASAQEGETQGVAPAQDHGFGASSMGFVPIGVIGDVFTCSSTWRVPAGYSVIATGDLTQATPAPEGQASFHFTTGDQLVFATFFAYGKYRSLERKWHGKPISVHWLNPEFDKAEAFLTELQDTLEFYTERFGEAPWPRFSIVEADVAQVGAAGIGPACMLLLFRNAFEKATPLPRNLMAHELAHQWWGNLVPVTLAEGYAPWLSEGVATYSDALYFEHKTNPEAARRHLTKFAHLYYDQVLHTKDKSLADAWQSSRIYRAVAYEKGARVLHLLRRTIGDQAFFAGLKRYATEYRYKESTVDAFRGCFEATSGRDLSTFFDDWVKRSGFPRLVVNEVRVAPLASGAGFRAAIDVEERGDLFRIPVLTIRLHAADGRVADHRAAIASANERFDIELPFEPVRIVLDPDDDVLKHPGPDNEWTRELAAARARRRGGGDVGKPAPAATFTGIDGTAIDLDQHRGSVVLLFFYATEATPCVRSFPDVAKLLGALRAKGLRAYAISLEDARTQAAFAAAQPATLPGGVLPMAVTTEETLDLFGGVKSIPTYVFIDRTGVVRGRQVGFRPADQLEDEARMLLDEAAPPAARAPPASSGAPTGPPDSGSGPR